MTISLVQFTRLTAEQLKSTDEEWIASIIEAGKRQGLEVTPEDALKILNNSRNK